MKAEKPIKQDINVLTLIYMEGHVRMLMFCCCTINLYVICCYGEGFAVDFLEWVPDKQEFMPDKQEFIENLL